MTPALAALLLAVLPAQQAAPFEVTDDLLDATLAAARPAVEKELGHALDAAFAGARIATPAEIEAVLARENEPILGAIFGEEAGRAQAQAFAEAVAPALIAKYAFEERAILVSPEALRANAELLAMPELLSAELLGAVLAHELVHADDVPRHGFLALCAQAADPDRLQALNAVLEGHAQHVARRACADLGNTAGFELFTRAISAEPSEAALEGEGVRMLQRIQRETFAALYHAGERFIAAVEARSSREGIERAFREPPRDMAEIHRPEWYLEPGLRPATRLELERMLDAFAAQYEERKWEGLRVSLDSAQLATAFAGFEEAGIERIRAALVRGRLLQLVPPDRSAMHYALACEWSSAADAAFVLEASEALLKRRDEDLREGTIRISGATYEPVAEEGLTGVYGQKRVHSFGADIAVAVLVLADGPLTLELLRSGEPGKRSDFLSLGRRLLAAARVGAGDEGPAEESPAPAGTGGRAGG